MRAALFVCLVLVATNAVLAAEENPCTGEVLRCRDEICAGREVLENVCEFGDGIFTKSCSCGGLVESAVQQRPDALQPENSFDELFQPSEDGTAYEEGVALGETQVRPECGQDAEKTFCLVARAGALYVGLFQSPSYLVDVRTAVTHANAFLFFSLSRLSFLGAGAGVGDGLRPRHDGGGRRGGAAG